MSLIVQKFGGTSVADPSARYALVARVRDERKRGNRVVVVVSAMGRSSAPYATDTLLNLVTGNTGSTSGMTADLVASCGETISCGVVAALLSSGGDTARPFTAHGAGIRADGPFGDAQIVDIDAHRILASLDAGEIPVVAGFQATNSDGDIVTLGRGGSDTSAIALGAWLHAERVDIYTDVPGVAMADPRIVPDAPFIEYLDYRSMYRLATNGARVLHDRSALLAERHGVVFRVRSTFGNGDGTTVGPKVQGREKSTLIGVAVSRDLPGTCLVNTILREGAGPSFAKAVAAAAASIVSSNGLQLHSTDDPDVISFRCAAAAAPELARTIFSALKGEA